MWQTLSLTLIICSPLLDWLDAPCLHRLVEQIASLPALRSLSLSVEDGYILNANWRNLSSHSSLEKVYIAVWAKMRLPVTDILHIPQLAGMYINLLNYQVSFYFHALCTKPSSAHASMVKLVIGNIQGWPQMLLCRIPTSSIQLQGHPIKLDFSTSCVKQVVIAADQRHGFRSFQLSPGPALDSLLLYMVRRDTILDGAHWLKAVLRDAQKPIALEIRIFWPDCNIKAGLEDAGFCRIREPGLEDHTHHMQHFSYTCDEDRENSSSVSGRYASLRAMGCMDFALQSPSLSLLNSSRSECEVGRYLKFLNGHCF